MVLSQKRKSLGGAASSAFPVETDFIQTAVAPHMNSIHDECPDLHARTEPFHFLSLESLLSYALVEVAGLGVQETPDFGKFFVLSGRYLIAPKQDFCGGNLVPIIGLRGRPDIYAIEYEHQQDADDNTWKWFEHCVFSSPTKL